MMAPALPTAALALALAGSLPDPAALGRPGPAPAAVAWPESAAATWGAPVGPAARAPAALRAVSGDGALAGAAIRAPGGSGYGGRADGRLRLHITPRLSAELHTALLARDGGAFSEHRARRSGARLRLGEGPGGAWLGVAFEHRPPDGRRYSDPLLSLGSGSRWKRFALEASLEQTVERVQTTEWVQVGRTIPLDTLDAPVAAITATRFGTGTSAVLTGRSGYGRLAIEATAGVTMNPLAPPRWWSQTSAMLALRPRLSVFATLGSPAPRWLAAGAGSDRGASLGVRLTGSIDADAEPRVGTPAAPAWRLRALGEGWHVVEIRAAGARAAEIMGDFTEWSPLPLRRTRGDRWALAVQLAPGVHQVQVRIDEGPWLPPAGLAATPDGFSGAAGVFVTE